MASAIPDPAAPDAGVPDTGDEAAVQLADAGELTNKALVIAPAATRYDFEGKTFDAPPGQAFALAMSVELTGDGAADALFWTVSADAGSPNLTGPSGQLWFYPSTGEARHLTSLPGFVPSGPNCVLNAGLQRTGPHTVTLDVSAQCEAQLIPRSLVRALVVVAPLQPQPVVLGLGLTAAAPGEVMEIAIDSADRDADGSDDVRVTVGVARSGTEPAKADLVWLDRAAGASRDTSEPGKSLGTWVASFAAAAKSKKTAANVEDRVNNTRRLLSTVCAEAGVPRVFDFDNNPLRCGDVGRTLDQLASLEVQAALTQNDAASALSVLARDGWYLRRLSDAARKQIERDIGRVLTKVKIARRLVLEEQPRSAREPYYSPFSFSADNALFVQTANAVARVAPDGSEVIAADSSAPSRPLDVVNDGGARWTGVLASCDRSELLLSFVDASGAALDSVPTRIMSPRPSVCAGSGSPPKLDLVPIHYSRDEFQAFVAGARLEHKMGNAARAAPAAGSPKSPDGRWIASASPLGILVTGERRELWQFGPELGGPDGLHHCVVANGARSVACLRGTAGEVFYR